MGQGKKELIRMFPICMTTLRPPKKALQNREKLSEASDGVLQTCMVKSELRMV